MTRFNYEEVVKGITDFNPNFHIRYEGNKPHKVKDKVFCKCDKCGGEYETTLNNLQTAAKRNTKLKGCRVCRGLHVIKGINDIATTDSWLLDYIDYDFAVSHTRGSKESAIFTCPKCHYQRITTVHNILRNGNYYKCSNCSDGISYPNKIGRSFIKQLPAENIHFEYSPKWANNRRYDIYFEYQSQKYVLEMDGLQHFIDTKWADFEYQVYNDKLKADMARQHDIKIIRIDCRQSRFKYIKNNLLDSKLNEIFDLSIIDWALCEKESAYDLVKEVCEYFNNHSDLCAKDLEIVFGIDKTTIQNYLNSGTAMGICSYTDEVKKRNRNQHRFGTRGNKVTVYQLDGTLIGEYRSAEQCALALSKIFDEEYKGSGITAAIRHSQSKYKNVIIKCEKENTLTDEEKEICKYFNDNNGCNANEIADRFNISYDKARIVLKRGTECGLCNYDSRKIFSKCAEIMNQHDKRGNKVIVSKNDSVIGEFTSVRSCVNYMNENYNSGFSYYSLTDKLALNNGHAIYKGYEFQYKENVV